MASSSQHANFRNTKARVRMPGPLCVTRHLFSTQNHMTCHRTICQKHPRRTCDVTYMTSRTEQAFDTWQTWQQRRLMIFLSGSLDYIFTVQPQIIFLQQLLLKRCKRRQPVPKRSDKIVCLTRGKGSNDRNVCNVLVLWPFWVLYISQNRCVGQDPWFPMRQVTLRRPSQKSEERESEF